MYAIRSYYAPPLSTRVDIREFTKKISKNAEIISVIINSEIAGLAAIYCNDLVEKEAYITTVIVDEKYRGNKIGDALINATINIASEKEMKSIKLEVYKSNLVAINLYQKLGFIQYDITQTSVYMKFKF